ncbi:FAD:protein FMN transferase, partial [Streptococcus suis]
DGVEAVFIDKEQGVHLSDGLKESFELKNEEYHLVNE